MVIEGDLDSLRQRIGVRHVIKGEPLESLQQQLVGRNLQPTRDGDRLLVDIGEQPAHEVTRMLATATQLTSFAPEQATLERIYLHAGSATPDAPEVAPATTPVDPEDAPQPYLGSTKNARRRTFQFESTMLLHHRSTLPLLLLPCAVTAFAVSSYSSRVREGLAKVEAGEQFSADAGSGFLAMAQSLQAATPVLTLAMLWFASQTIAGDLSTDTLRNSLIRSVRRKDVLFGKVFVLLAAMITGWLAVCVTSFCISWATVGVGDLEEISRFGDRDLLASASEIWPTLAVVLTQMTLPLAAIVTVAAAASVIAKRPALALATATALVFVPELTRGLVGENSGWLLTSHLPLGFRDDSALNYLAAVSRGAADALWVFANEAVYAPVVWLVASSAVLGWLVSRLRVS